MDNNTVVLHGSESAIMSRRLTPIEGFQQTGNWTWNSIMESTFTGSLKVYARLSAAGVDGYTAQLGQLLCGSFKLGPTGRRKLESAITKLRSMSSLGNIIHFGFGIDGLVRNLCVTEEGCVLAGLCAAATDTYHVDHAASIFRDMAKSTKLPNQFSPSTLQWRSLIDACAGVLVTTNFPLFVEHFMSLNPHGNRIRVGRYDMDLHPEHRGVSSTESLAEALLAIGKVSTGTLARVNIVGGSDGGWLAAIAHWFLDLRTLITDSDGLTLWHNFDLLGQPQVHIVFESRDAGKEHTSIFISGQVVRLRDLRELVHYHEHELDRSLVCGRVPWDKALSLTFGDDFRKLMERTSSVPKAMAAIAKIFETVAQADPGLILDAYEDCQTYLSGGSGRNFLASAVSIFPELGKFEAAMRLEYPDSFGSAQEMYNISISSIRESCRCSVCGAGHFKREETYCLEILLEAIIAIIRSMSGISNCFNIQPMRSGLDSFYRSQLVLSKQAVVRQRKEEYGHAGALIEFDHEKLKESEAKTLSAVRRLREASFLFSGRQDQGETLWQVATCVSGITTYLNILTGQGTSLDRETLGQCIVVPGNIEKDGHHYKSIEDLSDFILPGVEYRSQQTEAPYGELMVNTEKLEGSYSTANLVAKEEIEFIRVGLEVSGKERSTPVIVGPSMLVMDALRATGLVRCKRHNCVAIGNTPSWRWTEDAVDILETENLEAIIYNFKGNLYARLVALQKVAERDYDDEDRDSVVRSILRNQECLNCCVRVAKSFPGRKVTYINSSSSDGSRQ